jgi:hypothetical protein
LPLVVLLVASHSRSRVLRWPNRTGAVPCRY